MATTKIKKGDLVKVIAGAEKGKEGKVLSVDRKNGRVVVEGVNILTKHTKPSMANQNGGIVHQEGSIHISNVMYVHKGVPARLGFQVETVEDENGRKKRKVRRVVKKTGDVID